MKTTLSIRNVWLWLTAFVLAIPCGTSAQEEVADSLVVPLAEEATDTLQTPTPVDSTAQSVVALSDSLATKYLQTTQPGFVPDPIRSMWLGLIFPGGGQIYNKKYWKLPIIYGGFLGCAYALSWNNQMLRDYSQAYLDIMDSDPNTKSYEKMLPIGYDISGREEQFKEIFKNKKNYYRKYRDMSIFAFAAVYLIAVIDAYVDAELSTFDIDDDLSLRLAPAVLTTQPDGVHSHLTACQQARNHTGAMSSNALGMALRINF